MEQYPLTWSKCSNSKQLLLKVIQNRTKRIIFGKTPTYLNRSELQPLHHRRKVLLCASIYRAHKLNCGPLNSIMHKKTKSLATKGSGKLLFLHTLSGKFCPRNIQSRIFYPRIIDSQTVHPPDYLISYHSLPALFNPCYIKPRTFIPRINQPRIIHPSAT